MAARRGRGRAVWAGVSLATLALVTVGLTFLALTQRSEVQAAGSTPGATPRQTAPAEPSAAPAQVPPTQAMVVIPPTRVIDAIDASTAVRAASTTCPEPTTLEITADAGAGWETTEATGLASLQRLSADAEGFVSAIGLGVDGCGPAYERSFTSGDAWERVPGELAASWFIDPANRAGMHTPAGDVAAPCAAVLQVAVVDEATAAVLCEDGTVHATGDSGATWAATAPIPGVGALGATSDGYWVVVVDQNGCAGAQVAAVTVADGAAQVGSAGGCLEAAVPAGAVAVDGAVDGSTWVWAGDRIGLSLDGGASWL
ncbi:hypothetical protein ACWEOH_02675 [Agromyces sp. NPDC004153]